MKTLKSVLTVIFCCIFAALFAQQNSESFNVKRGERPPVDLRLVPLEAMESGVLLIKFSEKHEKHLEGDPIDKNRNGNITFGILNVDALCEQFSVKDANRLFSIIESKNGFTERHKAWGFHLWYKLAIDEKTDVIALVEEFSKLPEIETAEPEYKKVPVWKTSTLTKDPDNDKTVPNSKWTPNDPLFNQQWHYHNTGQNGGQPGADIDLLNAWDIEKGNPNVIVAIIDDGIDFNHPDLAANMWTGIGYNFVDNNTTIVPGMHGTHVAGTVAAFSNNNIGVAGIAGGSGSGDGVRLMSCQVFRESNNTYGGFHEAPVWAADNDASISQNSWSYSIPLVYNQSDLDAIDYFNANGGGNAISNGGLTIFGAANNSSSAEYYPAAYAGTLAVASTDYNDEKSYFSNFGPWVDVSAPGSDVLSTTINNAYTVASGTSMACPHVSGVAALIASISNGLISNMQVQDFIMQGADDITAANQFFEDLLGSGRLNAYNALSEAISALNGVFPPLNFTAVPQSTDSIKLSWIIPSGSYHILIAYSNEPISWNPTNGIAYEQGFSLPSGGTIAYNDNGEVYHHDELESGSNYYYKTWTFDETLTYSSARSAKATTHFCQIESKCEYTFRLISEPSFRTADTWIVFQNGQIEAILHKPNCDQFYDIPVALCGDASFELMWYPGGGWSDKAGIQIIGPYGNSIFEYLPQQPVPTEPILHFSGMADCNLPTCLMPINIVIEEVTEHQAVFDWQSQGTESLWNLEWGIRGFQIGNGNLIEGIENHPYVLTGLETGVYYDFRLQSNCGDGDLSFWSLPTTFSTSCGMFLLPLFEDFNDDPPAELPLCWSKTGKEGAESCWHIQGGGEVMFSACANNYAILTPPALQNGINNVKISFKARWAMQPTELFIGTIEDVNNGATFSPFDTLPSRFNSSEDGYANFITYIEIYEGSNNHIAFRHNDLAAAYGGFVMVDDILIEDISECPEPYNLKILSTTNNAAMISWKQAQLDGPWEIKFGAPGFNPETEGVIISGIQDQTFNINGLNSGSNYELYIRSNCQGFYSDWSTPLFFSTIPDPIQLPYFENFENSILPNMPPGYKNIGELWFGAKTYNDLGVSNSNSLYLIHGQYESKSILILPYIDSDIKDLMMYFSCYNDITNYYLEVGVIGDVNNPASFLSFENIPLVFGTHQEVNVDFSDYAGEDGNIAIRIEAGSTHQGGAHIWLDEIIIFTPSELPSIIFKEVSGITMNSAFVSGRVMHQGSQYVSSRGFVWNTEPNPTIENNNGYINMDSGVGLFESHLYNLNPGNTYYIRAFATNAVSTVYTEQEIFQTSQQLFNTVNATSGPGGNINPEGAVNVNYGQNQTFTITPNTGYEIADVLVDGVSVGTMSTYTFENVTANHDIHVDFELSIGLSDTPDNSLFVELYPNPAHDQITIKVQDNAAIKHKVSYKLFNLTGSLLTKGFINDNTHILNVSTLPAGVYPLMIYQNQTPAKVKKIIIH
jgi:subtilisin family serine protease